MANPGPSGLGPPRRVQPISASREEQCFVVDGIIHSPEYRPTPSRVISLSVPNLIRQQLRKFSTRQVAMAGDKYLKGEDVFEMMEKFASRFQISAIQPGDAVFTMLHNSLVNVAAALSLSFVGGVLFLADHELCNEELLRRFIESDASYILTDRVNELKLKNFLCSIPKEYEKETGYILLVVGKENEALDISKIKKKDALYVRHVPGSEDVMAVLYTSGSTRSPRGVPITHRAYVSSFESYRALEHVSAEDVFLAWTPLANNFGFSLNVFPMLLGVFTVFKEPTMTHIAFTAAMSRNDVTTTFNFPTRIRNLVRSAGAPFSFPCFKKLAIGGESTADITEILQAFNSPMVSLRYYGLAECFGLVIVSRVGREGYSDDGVPAPGCRVKIMPPQDDSEPNCEGCRGEILVQSNSLVESYYEPRRRVVLSCLQAPKRASAMPMEALPGPSKGLPRSTEGLANLTKPLRMPSLASTSGASQKSKDTSTRPKEPSERASRSPVKSLATGPARALAKALSRVTTMASRSSSKSPPRKTNKSPSKSMHAPTSANSAASTSTEKLLGSSSSSEQQASPDLWVQTAKELIVCDIGSDTSSDTGTLSTSLSEYQSELSKPGKPKREFWFRTGDEGQYTTSGCITIHGRLRRPN